MNSKNKNIIVLSVVAVLLTVYGAALVFLHYCQAYNPDPVVYFESDLPAHIEMAMDGWGYSLTALIYKGLSILPQTAFLVAVAVFLMICELGTLVATYYYFSKREFDVTLASVAALGAGFVMPAFVRIIQATRYIGYQSPSIWHNSTYICMKLFALLSIILYYKMCKEYGKKINVKDAIIFALLLAITTGVKTNFVLAFAPAALLMLVVDLVLGTPFKKVLVVALTVVPTIAVILFQEIVLFGEDTGNSIVIDPLYTVYIRCERPYFTMILSAAFPVLVFLANIVFVIKDTIADIKRRDMTLTHREFLTGWVMWTVAAAELLLFKETGYRSEAANFVWGYDFALFILFIMSMWYFVRNLRDRKFLQKVTPLKYAYIGISGAVLIYHVICGIIFFIRLLQGITYFA